MNLKIDKALEKLNSVLPLAENQKSLDTNAVNLHRAILSSYVDIGRSLSLSEIQEKFSDAKELITTLKNAVLVVFDNNNEPVGAYPFTMQEREHKVLINGYMLHCMCALDALAVSSMFDKEVDIYSECRESSIAVHIKQNGANILNRDDVKAVYVGINWNAASSGACCADSLCTEMIFLSGHEVAKNWQSIDPENRELFTMSEAIDYASRFFKPLVEQG